MIARLTFGCLEIAVEVDAHGGEALRALGRLAEDFENFQAHEKPAETLRVELRSPRTDRARAKSPLVPLFTTPSCSVRGIGPRRDVLYEDGVFLRSLRKPGIEHFLIEGDRAGAIHETAWEAILSAMGEALDRRGAHRVHALGIEWGARAGLIILPSGGGKSTLAALLASARNGAPSRVRILSEETPLVYRGRIHPFPVRLALDRKTARELDRGEGRPFPRRLFPGKLLYRLDPARIGRPSAPAFVILGSSKREPEASVRRVSRWFAFEALFDSMVVGLGVAQMREHMIRLDNLASLAWIALSRVVAAARVAWSAPAYRLTCSTDPTRTLETLVEFWSQAAIMGDDHGRDLLQTSRGAHAGELEEPLPQDGGGLPVGGAQPDRDVRRAEPRVPEIPQDPGQ